MCGIAGIVGDRFSQNTVPQMLDIMKHRGPDSEGYFASPGVQLGHCRLSINDLSDNARQPFISEKQNVAVAVNGEIYNYKELKKPLIEKGYVFNSNSDSEVVLHGYLEYGTDIFSELNGMFAIAVWDGRKKTLHLVRDRLGIKPLYYAQVKGSFLFASEIKALAQHNELDLAMDEQSFIEYMAFENYFSNRTLNINIKMVEPGEIVQVSSQDAAVSRKRYWTPSFHEQGINGGENIYSRYFDVVRESVRRHLISDVPVGAYLSSGIDSSSVVYCVSKECGHKLDTYTGFFGMSGFYDESVEAKTVANLFGSSNTRVEIKPQDYVENIQKVCWHLDEPRVGMGSFSQYMVAQRASQDVKVILTGHGGDEFFAGYPVFKAIYGKKHIIKLLLNSSRRELMFAAYFALYPLLRKEADFFLPNIFSVKELKGLLVSDYADSLLQDNEMTGELEKLRQGCRDDYERLTLTYLKYYLPALFVVEDKISMAFSLESRTPLCDNEMLDFALSIPLSMKLNRYELKHIPKTAMRGKLPEVLYNLPKRGFPTPLLYWFKNELKNYIKNFILDNIDYINMFKKKEVESLIDGYQNSRWKTPFAEITAHKLWILQNLIIYFKNQKERYRKAG
jgi:asparagine synthase (glutamine-hydrolysing)